MADEKVSLQVEIDAEGMVRVGGKVARTLDDIKKSAGESASGMSKFDSMLNGIGGRLTSFAAKAAGVISLILAAVGSARGIFEFFRSSVSSAGEAEQRLAQLEAGIRSTGGAAGLTAKQLSEMAAELQNVTTFSDDAIMGAEGILLTFTKIGGEVFPRVLETAADLATRLGGDLSGAAMMLGKALNDPTEGLTALSRAGVQFTDVQEKQIKAMVEAGRVAEAQAVILKELETQVGGSARAARETWPGALAALQNAVDDFGERVGGWLTPILTTTANLLTELFGDSMELADVFGQAAAEALRFGIGLGGAFAEGARIAIVAIEKVMSANAAIMDFLAKAAGAVGLDSASSQFAEMASNARENARGAEAAAEMAGRMRDALFEAYVQSEGLGNSFDKTSRVGKSGLKAVEDQAKATGAALKMVIPDKLDAPGSNVILSQGLSEEMKHVLELQQQLGMETTDWQAELDYVRANWQRIGLSESLANQLLLSISNRMGGVEIKSKETATNFEKWVDAGHSFANILGGINADLGQMLHGIVAAVDGFKALNKEGATLEQRQAAAANMAAGVNAFAGAGRSLGLWGPKNEQGTFGPGDSNYASEGQAVGAVVGAIIGGIIGAAAGGIGAAPGAELGAAIGGLIGEWIGSAINHGAPEAKAVMEQTTRGLTTRVYREEAAGMGKILEGVGEQIAQNLEQAMSALNAELVGIPTVAMKVRKDTISVTVGAVYGKFKSIDDAISFALTEILQQSEIRGQVSENVKNAIKNSLGSSAEELMENIALAMEFDRANWDPVQTAMADLMAQFRTNLTKAMQLGLDPQGASDIFARGAQDLRDSILGIQEDPAAAIRRKAALFNADIQLARANATLEIARLQGEREVLAADIALGRAEAELGRAHIDTRAAVIDAEGKLLNAERGILGGMIQSLAAVDQALAAQMAYLDALPDLISETEIGQAIGRLGRGGGRGGGAGIDWHQRMLSAVEGIAAAQKRLVFGDLSPFTGRQKVSAAQAEVDRLQALYNAGGRRNQTLAMEQLPQAIETYLQLFRTTYGSSGAYEAVAMQMNELYSRILRDHGVAPVSVMRQQATENADALSRIFQRDSRGKLQTRNEETEKELAELRRDSQAQSARVTSLLEEIRDNGAANSNGGAFAATRPPRPARLVGQSG